MRLVAGGCQKGQGGSKTALGAGRKNGFHRLGYGRRTWKTTRYIGV